MDRVRNSKDNKALFYALIFFLICLLALAGVSSFNGSSEAREAHVAQSILSHGDWVLPRRDGLVPYG